MVANGFLQIPRMDFTSTFAPVAQGSTARAFRAVAASRDCEIYQLDVKTAFLQANLDEMIDVTQPEGFDKKETNGEELVYRLQKSLRSLRLPPRNWKGRIHK